jgi:hypothetical protein
MPVSVGNDTDGGLFDFGASPRTLSHNNDGNLLIVDLICVGDLPNLAVTYNGVAMTHLGGMNIGTTKYADRFYLANPSQGSNTVSVSWTGGSSATVPIHAQSFIDGVINIASHTTASGTSTTPSVNVPSTSNDVVYDYMIADAAPGTLSPAVGAGQTEKYKFDRFGNEVSGGQSTEAGAASVTMSWSISASRAWYMMGVSIKSKGGFIVMF